MVRSWDVQYYKLFFSWINYIIEKNKIENLKLKMKVEKDIKKIEIVTIPLTFIFLMLVIEIKIGSIGSNNVKTKSKHSLYSLQISKILK